MSGGASAGGSSSDGALDRPAAIRPGEELDVERLARHLGEHLPRSGRLLGIEQFPGGYSNLTYLLRMEAEELVLRRPPFGNAVETAHDMRREHSVLGALAPLFPPAPAPRHYCADPGVIGAPFYVMERRRGIVIRRRPPEGMPLDAALLRRIGEAAVDTLARLHAIDARAPGIADLGRPEGYVERQISGWIRRHAGAMTREVDALDACARWLERQTLPPGGTAVIHNDYKLDNLLLDPADPSRIAGVLDWEMATVGEPLADLGTTLAYWVEAGDPESFRAHAFGPTAAPGCPPRREVLQRYAERSGRDVSSILLYYVLGLFKVAVIVEQIHARYVRGHTRDPRFAALGELAEELGRHAMRAVDRGSL